MRLFFLSIPVIVSASLFACGSRTPLLSPDVSEDGGVVLDGSIAPTCTPGKFAMTRATAELMFVLDRSGSMADSLDGRQATTLNPSRWSVLSNALKSALPAFESRVQMGAKFFPDPIDPRDRFPGDACSASSVIDTEVGFQTANQILDVFRSTSPLGGTPTAVALRAASDYFAGRQRSVARFIVLATDGAPNCNADLKLLDPTLCVCTSRDVTDCQQANIGTQACLDDQRTLEVIQNSTQAQIPTYVLGLGDPNQPAFQATLNRMAEAGGRAKPGIVKYYEGRNASEIEASLSEIEQSVTQCAYVTPSRPDTPDAIFIEIDGQKIARDVLHRNGWDWIDREFGEIAFFGDSCTRVTSRNVSVEATVQCMKK